MNKTLRLVISFLILGGLIWRTPWGPIRNAFQHLRLELWLAAFGTFMGAQVISALRWQLLARPLGFLQSGWRITGYYFIGMYFNLILPTSVGGDVVRAWYLDGKTGRRMAAMVSVLVDRFSGLLVLLVLACGAAVVCPTPLPFWVRASVWGTTGCFFFGALVLPILARWSARLGKIGRLTDYAKVYRKHLPVLLGTTSLSLIVQAASVILVWLVGLAVGAPVPASYYWILVPMVTLLTLLPVSLNGMGIREGGMILFLKPLGVDEGTAISLAFLWFSVCLAASLCGGVVYLWGCFPRPEVQSEHESLCDHSHQRRTGQPKAAA